MSTDTLTREGTASRAGTRAADVLDAVRALAPAIAARSDEIEEGRRLPPDLVADLRAAGCFRMLVPRRRGGVQAELAEHLQMVRELARADGSVGWTVMIGATAPVISALLPRATVDAVYADGPDMIGAGSFNPLGVAVPVDGGYRATGRWTFASGCQHADWFIAHCMVGDGRVPPLRMMVVPAADVEIIDTWRVSGLCGTGSHDFALDDVFVADDHTLSLFDPTPEDAPLGPVPELTFSSLAIANVALGIAEGALAEVTTLATAKVPMFADTALAANPLFRYRLGEASAHLRAAVALVDSETAAVSATAHAGVEPDPELRARVRSAATWATGAAAEVVEAAYTAGGGSALYLTSPLQRRLRDVRAVTQHFAVKPDTLTLAGAVLAGQEADLTFL
ncbi:MAG TPA: acyl-CoA dehydrogenase family protein [Acidimicrobiales bacterium]|jgi:alkylation response protein AidB-like acyl-CoA dehydrogenase|nr:acyl-CoA dehydrogenase family protein [Acidimicrobiales bacterium]